MQDTLFIILTWVVIGFLGPGPEHPSGAAFDFVVCSWPIILSVFSGFEFGLMACFHGETSFLKLNRGRFLLVHTKWVVVCLAASIVLTMLMTNWEYDTDQVILTIILGAVGGLVGAVILKVLPASDNFTLPSKRR